MKELKLKPRINIKNKQINISLPRKKLSQKLLNDLDSKKVKRIKFKINGWS